jgi:hypothetical protein
MEFEPEKGVLAAQDVMGAQLISCSQEVGGCGLTRNLDDSGREGGDHCGGDEIQVGTGLRRFMALNIPGDRRSQGGEGRWAGAALLARTGWSVRAVRLFGSLVGSMLRTAASMSIRGERGLFGPRRGEEPAGEA